MNTPSQDLTEKRRKAAHAMWNSRTPAQRKKLQEGRLEGQKKWRKRVQEALDNYQTSMHVDIQE